VRSAGACRWRGPAETSNQREPRHLGAMESLREAALEARRLEASLVATRSGTQPPSRPDTCERLLDLPVSDRSELISTSLPAAAAAPGACRWNLAQLRYDAEVSGAAARACPRSGGRIGPGTWRTQLGEGRRVIASRIDRLQAEVGGWVTTGARLAQGRAGLVPAGLVGYTNAGRDPFSMSSLTPEGGKGSSGEPSSSPTLDHTRTAGLHQPAATNGLLLTDTVGSIRSSPHAAGSFRFHLGETLEAMAC